MEKVKEFTGKTVNDAIKEGLLYMNVSEQDVDIEILDEGSKGIFGIIGTKLARVKISTKTIQLAEKAKAFLNGIISSMKVDAQIEVQEDDKFIYIIN